MQKNKIRFATAMFVLAMACSIPRSVFAQGGLVRKQLQQMAEDERAGIEHPAKKMFGLDANIKNVETLRQKAAQLRKEIPTQDGEERTETLRQMVDALETAMCMVNILENTTLQEQFTDEGENLHILVQMDLAAAHMRCVVAEDGTNHLKSAVEKLKSAEDVLEKLKMNLKMGIGNAVGENAATQVRAADSTVGKAREELESAHRHAEAAEKNFKLVADNIRGSPDRHLGPNSPHLKEVLKMHSTLLFAEAAAKEREAEILRAQMQDIGP